MIIRAIVRSSIRPHLALAKHSTGGNTLTLWLRPHSTTSSADESFRRRDGGQHGRVDRNNSGNYGNHLRRRIVAVSVCMRHRVELGAVRVDAVELQRVPWSTRSQLGELIERRGWEKSVEWSDACI